MFSGIGQFRVIHETEYCMRQIVAQNIEYEKIRKHHKNSLLDGVEQFLNNDNNI